jgi:ferredoxin
MERRNKMNNVMIMVESFTCTGCTHCELICPYGYIKIKDGDLDFPSPCVDDNCKKCGDCLKSCPFSNEYVEDEM